MILGLPIRRLRQITKVIAQRLDATERLKRAYITWQTKALAGFIAAGSMGGDQLVKQAQQLSMEPEDDKPPEPSPGSFERLAGVVSAKRPGT